MTKIFCDIADEKIIKKFNQKKIVKGFTTNPSLMRKAGAKNYSYYTKNILKITNKPVSCEVFADDVYKMEKQALIINSWGKNVGRGWCSIPANCTCTAVPSFLRWNGNVNGNICRWD